MKKKNDVIETIAQEKIVDAETVSINSNDVETPKRKGFFSK